MDIKTEKLSFAAGNNVILKNIDFTAENKDFIGIIGPNGSGKSTLLKCLYRTIRDYTGTIYIDGQDIREVPLKESALKTSAVSQINEVGFDISVMDMVLMGRAPYKKMMERDSEEDYRIAEESLMKADMLGFKERSYESLSGGEKQRVILARAFCQDTECIILDEPANHLDIRYQISLFNTLIKSGKTIITAVHDMNTALRHCNKICVLKNGKILAWGNTGDIITRELIRELFEVDSRIIDVEGKPTVVFL